MLRVLVDDTILPEIIERVFVEIIESFPTKMGKKDFGQMLLRVCIQAVEQNKSKLIFQSKSIIVQEKVDKLLQATEIYSSETQIWIPN